MYTIAHAIAIASHESLGNEVSWEGNNYCRQDSMGTRGVLHFASDSVIGVFRDDDSPRTPWRSKLPYALAKYLEQMPESVRQLAVDEPLRYMIDEYLGIKGPIITASFWSEGELVTAAEPWDEVVEHGAHLLQIELLSTNIALSALRTAYEFSPIEFNLLCDLFKRRMLARDTVVTLTSKEEGVLANKGVEGLAQSQLLLKAIRIVAS